MNQSRKKVWEILSKEKLVEGDIINSEPESPWYIKILLSISGWFGAFFLLLFVGGFFGLIFSRRVEDIYLLLMFMGGGLIYFAYSSFKEKQSEFLEHFMLALSITGQVMVIASLSFMINDIFNRDIMLLIAIFQAFLMWRIPNYIHQMMSSFFMASSLSYFFYAIGEPFIPTMILTFVVAWLWMNEFSFAERKKVEAIAYGQTVALLSVKYSTYGFWAYSKTPPIFNSGWFEFVSILTLVYIIWMILKESKQYYSKNTVLLLVGAVALLGLLSFQVSGLVLGVVLLLVGFAHSHNLLIGLGVFSSLSFLSYYYYYLGDTLMDKAGVLALMGVAILVSRWVVNIVLKKEASDV
jgi:uncharacterized membrane protein